MTTKAEWLALAERCEKATGADREIDALIGLALDWKTDGTRPLREIVPLYDSVSEFVALNCKTYTSIYSRDDHLPQWTGSLDAITALIERELGNAGWRMHRVGTCEPTRAIGQVMPPGLDRFDGEARTPALALCAAFCRAMGERVELRTASTA